MGRFDTEVPVHSSDEHNEMKRGMLCRYYRWRKLYGSMGRTEVRRCKDLEKENGRLRQIVSDLELDTSILKEALDFLGHRG